MSNTESPTLKAAGPVSLADLSAMSVMDTAVEKTDPRGRTLIVDNHRNGSSATGRGQHSEQTHVVPVRSWYLPVKALMDFVLSLALLVVAIPFIAVGGLLMKLTSPGPAFYRQVRVGRNGRTFTLVKIRTMVQNAEAATGPVWSSGTTSDSRITPLGRLLRDAHIDELPQLFNVLAGDMSLVGPRPERPEFVAQLERKVPNYRQRLSVKPGITGLAQILLPPDSGIDSVVQKVIHDVYYVRNCSWFLDLKLIAATGWKVVYQLTRYALSRFALPDPERIAHGYSEAVRTGRSDPHSARP